MKKNEAAEADIDFLPDLAAAPGDSRDASTTDQGLLKSIYDIPIKVTAVLGKTRLPIASLMKLGPGSVIELDRKVGEPIDLYVNDRLIGRGELVMMDGELGVTMTEIVKERQI